MPHMPPCSFAPPGGSCFWPPFCGSAAFGLQAFVERGTRRCGAPGPPWNVPAASRHFRLPSRPPTLRCSPLLAPSTRPAELRLRSHGRGSGSRPQQVRLAMTPRPSLGAGSGAGHGKLCSEDTAVPLFPSFPGPLSLSIMRPCCLLRAVVCSIGDSRSLCFPILARSLLSYNACMPVLRHCVSFTLP